MEHASEPEVEPTIYPMAIYNEAYAMDELWEAQHTLDDREEKAELAIGETYTERVGKFELLADLYSKGLIEQDEMVEIYRALAGLYVYDSGRMVQLIDKQISELPILKPGQLFMAPATDELLFSKRQLWHVHQAATGEGQDSINSPVKALLEKPRESPTGGMSRLFYELRWVIQVADRAEPVEVSRSIISEKSEIKNTLNRQYHHLVYYLDNPLPNDGFDQIDITFDLLSAFQDYLNFGEPDLAEKYRRRYLALQKEKIMGSQSASNTDLLMLKAANNNTDEIANFFDELAIEAATSDEVKDLRIFSKTNLLRTVTRYKLFKGALLNMEDINATSDPSIILQTYQELIARGKELLESQRAT